MALKFIKTSCQLVDAKRWLHNQAGSDFGLRAVGPDKENNFWGMVEYQELGRFRVQG